MKSNQTTSRNIQSNRSKKKSKSKSKSRSKSKNKQKKFNPINYLNTLIDMQNTVSMSSKKRKKSNREISSALTICSPFQQHTFSSSKMRSKTSTSNYRKKYYHNSKGAKTTDFKNVITEQQIIKFTQNSARCSQNYQKVKEKSIRNQIRCAIIIQRAWRNYKTYRMVHQHYLKAKQQELKQSKVELEKTLKINLNPKKKEEDFNQTEKFNMNKIKKRNQTSPIRLVDTINISEESEKLSKEFDLAKERQIQRWEEVIGIIQSQSQSENNQELLQKLLSKFEENKQRLEKQMDKQFQFHQLAHTLQEKSQSIDIGEKNVDFSILDDQISEKSLDSKPIDIEPEVKIFIERLRSLDQKKKKQMKDIHNKLEEEKIDPEPLLNKKQIILQNHNEQRKHLQKGKRAFINSIGQLKKNALKYLKESSNFTKPHQYELKKCFSADNKVIKCVLKEIRNKQFFDLHSSGIQGQILQLKELTPPKNTPEESFIEKNNTEMMKRYTQDIEQLIQKTLMKQFISEVYLSDNLYLYFKPYVEEVFDFPKISDQYINQFTAIVLPQHFPSEEQLFKRINQKINPTTLEILRIIRDPQFQIEEYELMIPEECFKKYRASVEKDYYERNKLKPCPQVENLELQMQEKVHHREAIKHDRMNKYRNFERDLKIMYMKSVFNCFNEFLIQAKSIHSFMNSRSSIGPGQLTLAIKQYNQKFTVTQIKTVLEQIPQKMSKLLLMKCRIPNFKFEREVEHFQIKLMEQIKLDFEENQFKWVNFMDEVLQIWQDISDVVTHQLLTEAINDIHMVF